MRDEEKKKIETKDRNDSSRSNGCGIFEPLLHRFVENELDRIRMGAVEEHLSECPRCKEVREELEMERLWLVESLVVTPRLSPRLSKKVRRRIERRLERKRQPAMRFFLKGAAVAAAAIVLGVFVGKEFQFSPTDAPELAHSTVEVAEMEVAEMEVAGNATDVQPLRAVPRRLASERRRGRFATLDDTSTAHLLPVVLPASESRRRLASFAGAYRYRWNNQVRAKQRHAKTLVVPAPAGRQLRSIRVYRFTARVGSGGQRLQMSDLVQLAARLTPQSRKPAPDDPCASDPNHDGVTDPTDLAYACQVVMGGPALAEAVKPQADEKEEGSFTESDCEEYCWRA